MVAPKRDKTRQRLSLLRRAGLVGIRMRSATQEQVMPLFNLLERVGVIIPIASNCKPSIPQSHAIHSSTYDVTGISPQSMTFAHESNGFALSGTLYPPLNPTLREPLHSQRAKSKREDHILEIEAAGTLSDAAGAEARAGTVRGARVEWGACSRVRNVCGEEGERRSTDKGDVKVGVRG